MILDPRVSMHLALYKGNHLFIEFIMSFRISVPLYFVGNNDYHGTFGVIYVH